MGEGYPPGAPRRAFLYRTLRGLAEQTEGRLRILHGHPAEIVPAVAQATGSPQVHVSADAAPTAAGGTPRSSAR